VRIAAETADPSNPCIEKVPLSGITFVGVPELQSFRSIRPRPNVLSWQISIKNVIGNGWQQLGNLVVSV
jgi:hypothetical protein